MKPANPKLTAIMEGDGFVTPARASDLCGIPTRTLYRMVTAGELRSQRVRNYWFVAVDSLFKQFPEAPSLRKHMKVRARKRPSVTAP